MTFGLVRVGELFSGHIRPDDRQRLFDLWTADPTLTIAMHELGLFIETGGAPDDEDCDDINKFVVSTYQEYDFNAEFMTIIRAAQDQGLAFIHVHHGAAPTVGLPVFDS